MSNTSFSGPSSPYSYDAFLEFRAKVLQMIAMSWVDPTVKEDLASNPRAAFQKYLRYDPPYQIDAVVRPDNAEWCPAGFTDWVVKHNEEIELFLPPPPTDRAQRVVALAAYNSRHIIPFAKSQTFEQ